MIVAVVVKDEMSAFGRSYITNRKGHPAEGCRTVEEYPTNLHSDIRQRFVEA
jgi:hypothetical protein